MRAIGHPLIGDVHGRGLLIGVDLTSDVAPGVVAAAQAAGFVVNHCTPSRLRLVPPLVLTHEQADTWLRAVPAVLHAAQ
jgi:acetylornithine aminotransferase